MSVHLHSVETLSAAPPSSHYHNEVLGAGDSHLLTWSGHRRKDFHPLLFAPLGCEGHEGVCWLVASHTLRAANCRNKPVYHHNAEVHAVCFRECAPLVPPHQALVEVDLVGAETGKVGGVCVRDGRTTGHLLWGFISLANSEPHYFLFNQILRILHSHGHNGLGPRRRLSGRHIPRFRCCIHRSRRCFPRFRCRIHCSRRFFLCFRIRIPRSRRCISRFRLWWLCVSTIFLPFFNHHLLLFLVITEKEGLFAAWGYRGTVWDMLRACHVGTWNNCIVVQFCPQCGDDVLLLLDVLLENGDGFVSLCHCLERSFCVLIACFQVVF
ncbi:hypothetical protein GBAR_LOCUS356 [Geodia barretti]|uniref:Uncharacterized protein n=1 Tax=Geodia barretti TaxID=519541 RepID=A0AA35VS48_GEOBA|nr:hypothetical protein GBAR_LOCUS356 [Geodia barretti]